MTICSHPAAARSAPALDSPSAANAHGDLTLTRLPNGLRVLVKRDTRFPLASLRLYVHAGSAYEEPRDAGISHLLEHMVFKGTRNFPKGAIAGAVEETGGYLNAATSFDYTVYLTDMIAEEWKTGLRVLKEMAFLATLDPEELELEKDVVLAEKKRGEDNPSSRLFQLLQEAALGGTPYGHPIIGHEETIRGTTVERMRAYIDRHYQPQSMLLVICGDVEPQAALEEAQALFGDLKNTRPVDAPPLVAAPHAGPPRVIARTGPWKKAYLGLAVPVPGMEDARSAQLDVLAHLLGGDATSRFYRTYKYEKRLVDSISVSNYSFERTGLLYIQAVLDPEKIEQFWTEFSRELAHLDSMEFSAEELRRAQLAIEDDLYRSKETMSGLASKLGYFYFFSNGEQGEANYLQQVRDTDQTILRERIRDTFAAGGLSVVAITPEGGALPVAGGDPMAAWLEQGLARELGTGAAAAAAQEAAAASAEAETLHLNNGTVILLPDATLPYASISLIFLGGDTLLSPDQQGLGEFTASLLTKGTKTLNAPAMEEFQSDRAASFSAASGRQSFSLSAFSPSGYTLDMFNLLLDVIHEPALDAEEAGRVRENQIASIIRQEDTPTGLAFRRLFPFLFKNHPYGYLQRGEPEEVAGMAPALAREFWERQTQQPWVLAVCGDFDREAVLAAAARLPAPSAANPAVPRPPVWTKERELDLTLAGRDQAHVLLVFPTVEVGHADEAGLDLLQNILAGQSGLLFRELRDRQGLGYTVSAFSWKAQQAGALIFYIGTSPDKVAQAEAGFAQVINELHTALLPEEEVRRGQRQMQGDYYRDHQKLEARSSEAAALTVLGGHPDDSRELVRKAGTLGAGDLRELSRKYLQLPAAYTVKVLP